MPNGPNFGDGVADYISNFSSSGTGINYSMERMDFRLSDKDSFYWRYVFDPSTNVSPRPVPTFVTTLTGTNHFLVLSETHVVSATALNEFRFAFNRTVPGAFDGPTLVQNHATGPPAKTHSHT